MVQQVNLHQTFRSKKFYPPRPDDSRLLIREKILTYKLPGKGRGKKIIVVEAQAGQGKTTLIYQYVTYTNKLYCWHRIDVKDADPVLFLTALYLNLKSIIPDFESPRLARVLGEGAVEIYNLSSYVNILLSDIDQSLDGGICLIFDDLHLIEGADKTNELLDYIIETSPPKIQFILSSRQPLLLNNKTLRNKQDVLTLKTADLALDTTEIEELFKNIFNRPIGLKEATAIQKLTDGWIMGIVLIALDSSGRAEQTDQNPGSFSSAVSLDALSTYFHNETFSHISQDLHKPFLKLSLLNELPTDLADQIIGRDDLGQKLDFFTRSNYFIYKLDEDRQTFCFHRLFQEYLQNEAKKQLQPKEIQEVYSLAADYYLEQQNVPEALSCYFKAGNFSRMDDLLRKEGLGLLAQNLNITIHSVLENIQEDILHKYGWLSLFAGILRETSSPHKTLPLLENARELFISHNQEVGELLALAQTIYFHFVISGLYKEGAKLLDRTEELLGNNFDGLTPLEKILVSRNLAAGFCFFTCEMEKAQKYGTIAKDLATELSIVNFIASSRFVLGYIGLIKGDRAKSLREAEYLYTLLPDPVIGMQNKLSLLFMQLDDLSKHGDYVNFFSGLQLFQAKVDDKLAMQTVAAPYLFIYQSIMFVGAGELERALEIINNGISSSETATTSHMQSQSLQWRAYIYSKLGNYDGAVADLEKSVELRELSGGTINTAEHLLVKGATCTVLNKQREAEEALNHTIKIAETIDSPYLTCSALMHRAYLRIQQGMKELALEDLEKGLRLMRKNNYTFFWSWEPTFILTLLSSAITNNIEKEFARKLARIRLYINIDNDGTIIPLLKFAMLDGFTIHHGDELLFSSRDFSEKQKELFDLLLTRKHQQIKFSTLQELLWPKDNPEKTRVKFDSLLARLRKALSLKLQVPVKHYLTIKRSILYLSNCIIDTEEFQHLAEKGIDSFRNELYWQAGNYFNQAFVFWKGTLPEDTFYSDNAITYSYAIENKLIEMTIAWGKILLKSGLIDEAIQLLENLIERFRENDFLITFLYELYRKNNDPVQANNLLKSYQKELEKNDYLEVEIEGYINNVIDKYEKSQRAL